MINIQEMVDNLIQLTEEGFLIWQEGWYSFNVNFTVDRVVFTGDWDHILSNYVYKKTNRFDIQNVKRVTVFDFSSYKWVSSADGRMCVLNDHEDHVKNIDNVFDLIEYVKTTYKYLHTKMEEVQAAVIIEQIESL